MQDVADCLGYGLRESAWGTGFVEIGSDLAREFVAEFCCRWVVALEEMKECFGLVAVLACWVRPFFEFSLVFFCWELVVN